MDNNALPRRFRLWYFYHSPLWYWITSLITPGLQPVRPLCLS